MKYNFDEFIDRKGTYSTQWDFISDRFGRNDILPFSISDTDFKIPQPVTQALKKATDLQIYGYTRWNHNDYKNAIINYYQRHYHVTINPDWIVYSPSVMYSLSSLIELLTQPGDHVCAFAPMYTDFEDCTLRRGCQMIRVYLNNQDNYFTIPWIQFEEALSQSQAFLLCSPHNPTGRVWKQEELLHMLRLCQKYDVPMITDEIHMDIILEGQHTPIINYQSQYPRIFSMSSGSKTFNFPALGGSYALIPDKNIREEFLDHTKHRDFVNSASYMGIIALMSAYNDCDDYVEQLREYIRENMALVESYIHEHCAPLKFKSPEGTYLAWIDCRDLPFTADQLQDALVNQGHVGMMKGEIYFGKGYLRMNVGCLRSKVLDGLERLQKSLNYLYEHKKDVKF